MKTAFFTIAVLASTLLNAQEISVGDTVMIDNVRITKIEGSTKYGYTELTYLLPKYVIGEISQRADEEMWDEKKKAAALTLAKKISVGGRLRLEIGRLTIESANTKYFTVIIKKDGKELKRVNLDDEMAELPGRNELWWNIAYLNIPITLNLPFDVYVIDAISKDNPKFHFRIMNP